MTLRQQLTKARRTPQAPINSTIPYAAAIVASDAAIDFSMQTAATITGLERAIGHQRSLTVHSALPDGRAVSISGLRAISARSAFNHRLSDVRPGIAKYSRTRNTLLVACIGGQELAVDRLQTQDRTMMAAKEWWNGVKGMGLVNEGVFKFNVNNHC